MTELAVEPLQMSGEPDEKYADVVLARVGELAAGRQIAGIKARLQRMNPEEDQAAYGRVFGELVGLEQRRKWLLDRASAGPESRPFLRTERHFREYLLRFPSG